MTFTDLLFVRVRKFLTALILALIIRLTFHSYNSEHLNLFPQKMVAKTAGAAEYTDPTPNECPGYDTKQSDGEVPVMLELWGMWSTPSLPLLPGPLWPRVVAPDRALSMG